MTEVPQNLDIRQIREILPHRYPFLLIDKIIEIVDNEKIVGIKNVTCNEEFFQGHFPHRPIMPGVLVMESMAQVSAVLARVSTNGIGKDRAIVLCGAENFKWKRQVIPGDTLRVEMRFVKRKGPFWVMIGETTVDGAVVCSGSVTAAEVDN